MVGLGRFELPTNGLGNERFVSIPFVFNLTRLALFVLCGADAGTDFATHLATHLDSQQRMASSTPRLSLSWNLVFQLIGEAMLIPEIEAHLHLNGSLTLPVPILPDLIGKIEKLIRWSE
jgi:hypothetical protein